MERLHGQRVHRRSSAKQEGQTSSRRVDRREDEQGTGKVSTEGQLFEDNEEKLTRIKKCDQNVKKWNKLSAVNHLIAQQSLLHNGRMQIKSSGQLDP